MKEVINSQKYDKIIMGISNYNQSNIEFVDKLILTNFSNIHGFCIFSYDYNKTNKNWFDSIAYNYNKRILGLKGYK